MNETHQGGEVQVGHLHVFADAIQLEEHQSPGCVHLHPHPHLHRLSLSLSLSLTQEGSLALGSLALAGQVEQSLSLMQPVGGGIHTQQNP
jgi:hypothetical protein